MCTIIDHIKHNDKVSGVFVFTNTRTKDMADCDIKIEMKCIYGQRVCDISLNFATSNVYGRNSNALEQCSEAMRV